MAHTTRQCGTVQPRFIPLDSVVQSSQGSYHWTVWYSPAKVHTTRQCGTVQPRFIPLDSVVQSSQGSYHWTV
ncbi:hypothetical protein BgiBS90_029381 [Biomphalaria glabrata]|nr:hypothetical protein BgiBS90_029381 [Biomphalaria glabrata]